MLKSQFSPKLSAFFLYTFGGVVLLILGIGVYIELTNSMTLGEQGYLLGEMLMIGIFIYKLLQSVQGLLNSKNTYEVTGGQDTLELDENLITALDSLHFKLIGGLTDGSVFYVDQHGSSLAMIDKKDNLLIGSLFEDGYLMLSPVEKQASSLVPNLRLAHQQHQSFFNPASKIHGAVKSVPSISVWLDWDKKHGSQFRRAIFLDSIKLWLGLLMIPLTLYINRLIIKTPVDINNPVELLGLNNPTAYLFVIGLVLVIWAVKARRLNIFLFR